MSQLGWTFNPDNPVYQVRDDQDDGKEILDGRWVIAYLWSRTLICPNCTGLITLAPNWKLSRELGIRLKPDTRLGLVGFEVVAKAEESLGTIRKGIAICPLCGYICPKGYPASEAQAQRLGQVLYCKVIKTAYPIYRGAGKKPIQGVKPREYIVPDKHIFHSDKERWRLLVAKGWADMAVTTDPLLAGVFGGEASGFAPGVEILGMLDDDEI